jgi:uncharacterized repeat protein (TIGR03803 family)
VGLTDRQQKLRRLRKCGAIAFALSACCGFELYDSAQAATETVVYSFQNDGADGVEPYAGLIEVKGQLYGTTSYGGTGTCNRGLDGCGTVFSVDPATGAENVVYSFQDNGSDGAAPNAVIEVGNYLYGTTIIGGKLDAGTVFEIDLTTDAETVLYSFYSHDDDGIGPQGSLTEVRKILYGVTPGGGDYQLGTVFSFDPMTKTETVVHAFCGTGCGDGEIPDAALLDVKGMLYGTTQMGGAYYGGTVFAVDPSNRTESVIYSFCAQQNCPDGDWPQDTLVDVNGLLYGTTDLGGAYREGTVFSLDPSTGKEKVLYSFQGSEDGVQPVAGMIQVGDKLYGTTSGGGEGSGCEEGCGTVFSFDMKTGREKVLHAFSDNGTDGAIPDASLVNVNGILYGTTVYGGTGTCTSGAGCGTVFAIKP